MVYRGDCVLQCELELATVAYMEGKLVWSADAKGCLFSAHFDAKQCKDIIQQSRSCDPSPAVLLSVASRSSFICSLFLDPYGGNAPDGSLFYKQVARNLASKLAVILSHLAKEGSFLAFWRLADVIPVSKGSPFSDVGDYKPISITTLPSNVF